jgi:uncharacterized protein
MFQPTTSASPSNISAERQATKGDGLPHDVPSSSVQSDSINLEGVEKGSGAAIRERFTDAVDHLVRQLQQDRSILAAILCGSLSHDKVWDKSDVDLVLIAVDDKKAEEASVALCADGVNVHALLMSRTEFRKIAEGSLRNSVMHSFLAKGRVLYAHDDSITRLCARLQTIGERDTQLQLLRAGTHALAPAYKAHKFFVTRGDLEYTALWILYAATSLARIEIISRRLLADREAIPQAMQLNPRLFKIIYTDLLNNKKTRTNVQAALDAIDRYLAEHAEALFGAVIEYLKDAREARSATEIEAWFKRNFDIEGVTAACEYLADQKLIGKASTPVQLTRRSNVPMQELAFFYIEKQQMEETPFEY